MKKMLHNYFSKTIILGRVWRYPTTQQETHLTHVSSVFVSQLSSSTPMSECNAFEGFKGCCNHDNKRKRSDTGTQGCQIGADLATLAATRCSQGCQIVRGNLPQSGNPNLHVCTLRGRITSVEQDAAGRK